MFHFILVHMPLNAHRFPVVGQSKSAKRIPRETVQSHSHGSHVAVKLISQLFDTPTLLIASVDQGSSATT